MFPRARAAHAGPLYAHFENVVTPLLLFYDAADSLAESRVRTPGEAHFPELIIVFCRVSKAT